jgi:hypothetical protein
MSKIINLPRKNNFFLNGIRGTLEHRATWLYLLLKEAEKNGIAWEAIGFPAIRACGHMHGQNLVKLSGTNSLKGLKRKLFTLPAQWVFEMKVLDSTDNRLSIDFGYCPLVAAWQNLGCSDEEIVRLCDIAMEGDRGIAETFGATLDIGETIARGFNKCQIRFSK